jgi:hypothetical protein
VVWLLSVFPTPRAFQKQKLIVPTRAENAKSWMSHTGINQSSNGPPETTMPGGDPLNSDGNHIAIWSVGVICGWCQAWLRRLMPPTTVYDGGPYAVAMAAIPTDVAPSLRPGLVPKWSGAVWAFSLPDQINRLTITSTVNAAMPTYIMPYMRRSCDACRSDNLPVIKSVNGSCTAPPVSKAHRF